MDSAFLEQSYYGLTVMNWLQLAGVWILITLVLMGIRRVMFGRFSKLANRTKNRIDDVLASMLEDAKVWFFVIVALYLAVRWTTEDAPATETILRVVFLGFLAQAGMWAAGILQTASEWYAESRGNEPSQITASKALVFVGRMVVWLLVLLMALDNFGVDITALIAGLGIGGIAIALALQTVLSDLLAYISIVADQPFVYGDFMVVGDMSGTVEHVGIKSTRLRSLSGEQLVFSNSDLLSSRIRNFQRMNERRVLFGVGVEYDTPHDKLTAIPDMLKESVEAQDKVRFDRAHLKGFGDSSINFEIVYYMLVPEYAIMMDTQQQINLTVHKRFEDNGIVFAFPTRTIHIESMPTGGGNGTD